MNLSPLTVGIRDAIYNGTKYCMTSAFKENKMKKCRELPNADLFERAAQVFWQVNEAHFINTEHTHTQTYTGRTSKYCTILCASR
jgi:hypothetical protein